MKVFTTLKSGHSVPGNTDPETPHNMYMVQQVMALGLLERQEQSMYTSAPQTLIWETVSPFLCGQSLGSL
jgi:hypothetical protein